MIPNIQHFLFIKDTEELCFVEKGGRSRIFNLVNQQFRPAICNLPLNTANILSSPDGSCIVAFVKEKLVDNKPFDNVTGSKDDNDEIEDDNDSFITDDIENSENDSVISTDDEGQRNDSVKDDNIKEICRAYVYFCANFGGPVSKGM